MVNPTQILNDGVFFVAAKGYNLPNWFYRVEAFNQEMRIVSLSTLFSEESHFVPMEKISLLHFAPGFQKLKERQEYDRIDKLLGKHLALSKSGSPDGIRERLAKLLSVGEIDELVAAMSLLEQQHEEELRVAAKKWWEFWK